MRTRKRRGKRGGLGKRNPGEEGNTDEGGKGNTTVWANILINLSIQRFSRMIKPLK